MPFARRVSGIRHRLGVGAVKLIQTVVHLLKGINVDWRFDRLEFSGGGVLDVQIAVPSGNSHPLLDSIVGDHLHVVGLLLEDFRDLNHGGRGLAGFLDDGGAAVNNVVGCAVDGGIVLGGVQQILGAGRRPCHRLANA